MQTVHRRTHKQKKSHPANIGVFSSGCYVVLLVFGLKKHRLCVISHTRLTSFFYTRPCTHMHTHAHKQIPSCQQAKLIKKKLANWHAVILLAPIIKVTFFSTPLTSPCLCNGACYFLTFNISPHITVSYVNNSLNKPQVLEDLLLLGKLGLQWYSPC